MNKGGGGGERIESSHGIIEGGDWAERVWVRSQCTQLGIFLVLVRVTCMVQIHPYQTVMAHGWASNGGFHILHFFLKGLQNTHTP